MAGTVVVPEAAPVGALSANLDVHRRDPQRQLYVDTRRRLKRLKCAHSSYSPTVRRRG
jgi:hypothetical protein